MILILDGSKGSGKSTTAELLCGQMENVVSLSLDIERCVLANQERPIQERNKEAFDILLKKCAILVSENKNVVIDCGLTAERVPVIEKIANDAHVKVHKFLLKAPYEIQLERVRSRDALKDKETDEDRFEKVHKILYAKTFDGFITIETDKVLPQGVVDIILKNIV
jgi:predicted kinase